MNQASNPGSSDEPRISRTDFLRSFFRDYRTVGAIRETSRGVAERIAELGNVREACRVVELGCGTGPITRTLLERMPSDATLWGYEVHPPFADHLRKSIDDSRFTLFESSAIDLPLHLEQGNMPPFDAVISTIPFSYLKRTLTTQIIRGIIDSMTDDGRFVALQYHPTYLPPMLRREFDRVDRELYLWNLPPATLLTATQPRRL